MDAPGRFIVVRPANPSHKLPMPGTGRQLPADGERVDSWDPFWEMCLKDGSVVKCDASSPKPPAPPAIPAV
jgi:hypothetical protein